MFFILFPNFIASNFSSNVLLRICTVSVVSNFVGSLQYLSPNPFDNRRSSHCRATPDYRDTTSRSS